MSRIPIPHDTESAEYVLGKFADNAFSTVYEENFKIAVNLKHGPFFSVQRDSSQRMYFHCTICNKDLNNVRSLIEHVHSGNHNKNKDAEMEKKGLTKCTSTNYPPSTLQFKISKSDNSTQIVGLQRVTAYAVGWGVTYYKCILCGAHGKVDAMYNHLIGDKHTDKYIRSRIVLKNSVITGEERTLLRNRIFTKENYTIDDIKMIKGRTYYPYKWENEGRFNRFKQREMRESLYSSRSPHSDGEKYREAKETIKKEVIEDSDSDDEQLRFRNRSPPSTVVKKEPIVRIDKAIQSYSVGFLTNILLKFNVIIQAHLIKDTDLHSPKDLKVALSIMRYALHLYFYVYGKDHSAHWDRLKQQRETIRSCLGYLMKRLIPYFEANYGKLEY